MDNRFYGTLEYYNKNTSDLLVPVETGDGRHLFGRTLMNVINKGVELLD